MISHHLKTARRERIPAARKTIRRKEFFMNNRTLMTIQERIERTKNSMAYSPEDAAEKTASIANTLMPELLTEKENALCDFPYDTEKYADFCRSLKEKAEKHLSCKGKGPYETELGNSISDTVFSLALTLATIPGRFKDKKTKPRIFYDTRMTLGDYLDALIDLTVGEDGSVNAARAERYRRLKEEFSGSPLISKPFCKAVGEMLEQYCEPRAELDRASHIINCSSYVRCREQEREMQEEYLDNEYFYSDSEDDFAPQESAPEVNTVETDETAVDEIPDAENITPASFVNEGGWFDEEYCSNADIYEGADRDEINRLFAIKNEVDFDPFGYYLSMAEELPKDKMLDFENSEYHLGAWADALLLLHEDFSPEAQKAAADKEELYPQFRELFDRLVTAESVSGAFKELNAVINRLYRLIVEPFAELGKYHFERHTAGGI